jgi:pimeloyl-ACP methyl ester carboxylesterase
MGADIVRLLDQLGIPKAHIVGYSMGAAITAQLLTMNPERFLTATLGGAGGRLRWSAEENRMIDREAAEIEQGTLRSLILRLTPPSEPKPTDEEIRKISEAFLAGQDRLALAAVKRSYRNQAVTEAQMAAVKVPTLGIIGSADPSMAMMNVQKEAMPTLKVVIIGGGTHGGERAAFRRPEFVKAIREFI